MTHQSSNEGRQTAETEGVSGVQGLAIHHSSLPYLYVFTSLSTTGNQRQASENFKRYKQKYNITKNTVNCKHCRHNYYYLSLLLRVRTRSIVVLI